jgi:erythronate-4-phosphate dehydrogenase
MKIIADANIPFAKECFSHIGDVELISGRHITPKLVADADVLLVRSITRVDADLLAKSHVRFVGTATIGFDHVDVDFLRRSNIGFASAPGSNSNSAAEYVIAALLEIGQRHNICLEDKSIGIIGVGNVGSKVAAKCNALGMRIFCNDPPLQRQTGDSKYLSVEALYDCDFITLHTPLTFEGVDKTFHLANDKFFQSLKKGCVFLNAARGAVVDGSALKEAISSARLQTVVLDVWENEPNVDTNLLEIVDVGTPHIAGYSLDGKIAGMIMMYNSVCRFFDVEPKFSTDDFLPEPSAAELVVDSHRGTEQDVLLQTVRSIYDIRQDDVKLRRIINEPAEKRGAFFDKLRKEYPVRREFQNTCIIVDDENSSLAWKLKGIGFQIRQSK